MQGFRRLCKAVGQPILGSDKRQPCANGDCPVGTAAVLELYHVQYAGEGRRRGRAQGGGRDQGTGSRATHGSPKAHAAQLCQQALTLGNTHSCLVCLRPQHSNCIFQQSAVGNRLNRDTLTDVLPAAATTTVCEANTDTEANTRPDLEAIQRLRCSCPSPCCTRSSLSKSHPVPGCPDAKSKGSIPSCF